MTPMMVVNVSDRDKAQWMQKVLEAKPKQFCVQICPRHHSSKGDLLSTGIADTVWHWHAHHFTHTIYLLLPTTLGDRYSH